jgi:hypothetical protein
MRTMLIAAVLSLAAHAGCSKSDSTESASTGSAAEASFPAMTVDEVDRAITAKQAQAVDCNMVSTRKQDGVVPGAIVVSSLHYAASELPADKTAKLVFYCADSA